MKIDFSKSVKTIGGVPLKKNESSNDPVTLQFLCREALLGTHPDEKGINGEEKLKRWDLAKKCDGVADLKIEEIAKIKELAGKMFAPGVVGPVYEALEGN